jgi:type VI secretion system protein ImpL
VARFANMGLTPTQPPHGVRPGGLPLHGYLRDVVLPERELVPLRSRWRDHKTVVVPFVLGLVLWLAVLVTALVLALE